MYLSTRTQRGLFAGARTGTLVGVWTSISIAWGALLRRHRRGDNRSDMREPCLIEVLNDRLLRSLTAMSLTGTRPKLGIFTISRELPLGVACSFDWGFIPGTRGDDGDPLDAMVLHHQSSYPGAVLLCRI